ncbi:MAG: hypothetical protein R6V85_10530 [Polyangia bacterium]
MIRIAPVALLLLAAIVPFCTGIVWGNLLLLAIVCGIFFGTVSLGGSAGSRERRALADNES